MSRCVLAILIGKENFSRKGLETDRQTESAFTPEGKKWVTHAGGGRVKALAAFPGKASEKYELKKK